MNPHLNSQMIQTGKSITLNPFLAGKTREDLQELCRRATAKPVHAKRLFASVHRHRIFEIDLIPDLPGSLRTYLKNHQNSITATLMNKQRSQDGTRKFLLGLVDGDMVETVLIPTAERLTLCISTQVGCALGCRFCLTSTNGLKRNISTVEMLAQIQMAQSQTKDEIRNLVLMGMGEPFHNFDAVARFVRIITDPLGMAFSPKRVTVSTAGLVPGIYRMIEENLPCNLAISLHATTDEIRDKIMPTNRRYPIKTLMDASRDFNKKTGKRLLIEYALLAGVNDSNEDAQRLVMLLQGLPCTINLLPLNESKDIPYRQPDQERIATFRSILSDAGYVVVVRESRGEDILAACGQLSRHFS
ncbi:MAG: 23S rRNA (adenine(2503)-C(2))-methyltransferase RlmN [Mariprofundaceae bacterium]